jgi:hypothetical protein
MAARDVLATFDVEHIPSLDVAVMGALELFAAVLPPPLHIPFARPLVLGSGNAFMAAQIIFADTNAVFADESSYEALLVNPSRFDGVVVMSASGSKHAIPMVEKAKAMGMPVHLVTNAPAAPAAALLSAEYVHVYPKNREPYTYNTSTYLGPVLGHTAEDPGAIRDYITSVVSPRLLRNFEDYGAFVFIIPAEFLHLRTMLRTKFDELFGARVVGRIFTPEEIKHAKTVIVSGDELFISFGVLNTFYGLPKNRLFIPLPTPGGYATVLAATYFVVGKIQTAHPPYFAQAIDTYAKVASEFFGHTIDPIVE